MKARNSSYKQRWVDSSSYDKTWDERSFNMMQLFMSQEYVENSKYTIAEFGCGAYAPFHSHFHRKNGFEVRKFDLHRWDIGTEVIDFNKRFNVPSVDIATFSGVLEYINDVPTTLKKVMSNVSYILMSYAFVPSALSLDDSKYLQIIKHRAVQNGWRNHYTNRQIVEIVSQIGVVSNISTWNKNQSLFLIRNHKTENVIKS